MEFSPTDTMTIREIGLGAVWRRNRNNSPSTNRTARSDKHLRKVGDAICRSFEHAYRPNGETVNLLKRRPFIIESWHSHAGKIRFVNTMTVDISSFNKKHRIH